MPGLIPAPNKTKTKIFKFSTLQKIAFDHHLKTVPQNNFGENLVIFSLKSDREVSF
jgi:hypothetical protein